MAIKKSEIYSELWKSCDELRGGMDASQYKDYILAILFVKYLSDKYSGIKDSPIIIPKGGSFADMVALKGNSTIGDGINKILAKLAEENGLKGIIDVADFDNSDKLGSGKTKVEKLSNIIAIFQSDSLDFSKNRADGDDILGDAFEYLMRHFATESGKSKGQFYTPSEVSQIIAKVIGAKNAKRKDWTVYDPTAGSGSLLLKVAHETPNGITIYGQENDVATTAMAQMNMWIHNNVDADIRQENTISHPLFKNKDDSLKTFDFVVSNPPFSNKSWSTGIDENNDEYKRFDGYGIPPKKNGDYAFLLHVIKSLNSTGKGAIILPRGVLFRGGAEAEIRKNIIKRGYIKGIIGLPANLFYGTGIPSSIIILDKENAESRKGIFMINASKGFVKDGSKNKLQVKDIHKIVDSFTKQLEISQFSRLVPLSEIANKENNYNLNITKFVDNEEKNNIQDIEAHLKGGIPINDVNNLEKYWKEYPTIKKLLFSPLRSGYVKANFDKSEIKSIIFEHNEFKLFLKKVKTSSKSWEMNNISLLEEIQINSKPKEIIHIISEDLLEKFSRFDLVDKYDIYQQLMNYWIETMQDDVYLISSNGWNVSLYSIKDKNEKVTGWNSELIPKEIMISKYFTKQKDELEKLHQDLGNISQEILLIDEENQGEVDLFSEVRENKKISKKDIVKRIKDIKNESEFIEELKILSKYTILLDKEKKLKHHIKSADEQLDKDLLEKFKILKEYEIKKIIIYEKWITSIRNSINEELDRVSYILAIKLKEFLARYETPLPDLSKELKELTKKFNQNLIKMDYYESKQKTSYAKKWKEHTLSSLCKSFTKQTGFDYTSYIKPKLVTKFKMGTIPFIQNKDFASKKINYDTDYYIPEIVANKFPRILLDEKCLLISISGSIGKIGLFSNSQKSFIGGAVAVAKFIDKDLLEWVMFYLLSNEGQKKLHKNVKTGSHKNLILSDLREMTIPIPSTNERKYIIQILSNIDSGIEELEKKKEKHKMIKDGVTQKLFTGKIIIK